MKHGKERNSELKLTSILGILGTVAVTMGWLNPDDADTLVRAALIIAGGFFGGSTFKYSESRGVKKAADIKAQAMIEVEKERTKQERIKKESAALLAKIQNEKE